MVTSTPVWQSDHQSIRRSRGRVGEWVRRHYHQLRHGSRLRRVLRPSRKRHSHGQHRVGVRAQPRRYEKEFSRLRQSTYVDTSDLDQVRAAIRPNTKVIYVETPSNPTMQLTDLAAVARIAHAHGS